MALWEMTPVGSYLSQFWCLLTYPVFDFWWWQIILIHELPKTNHDGLAFLFLFFPIGWFVLLPLCTCLSQSKITGVGEPTVGFGDFHRFDRWLRFCVILPVGDSDKPSQLLSITKHLLGLWIIPNHFCIAGINLTLDPWMGWPHHLRLICRWQAAGCAIWLLPSKPAKPAARISLQHGSSPLSLGRTPRQQGFLGDVVTWTCCNWVRFSPWFMHPKRVKLLEMVLLTNS